MQMKIIKVFKSTKSSQKDITILKASFTKSSFFLPVINLGKERDIPGDL